MNKPQDFLDNTEFIIQERVSFSALRQRAGRERGEQAFKAHTGNPALHLEEKEEREEKAKETNLCSISKSTLQKLSSAPSKFRLVSLKPSLPSAERMKKQISC